MESQCLVLPSNFFVLKIITCFLTYHFILVLLALSKNVFRIFLSKNLTQNPPSPFVSPIVYVSISISFISLKGHLISSYLIHTYKNFLNTPLKSLLLRSLKFFYLTQFIEKYCFLSVRIKLLKTSCLLKLLQSQQDYTFFNSFCYEGSFSDHLIFSRSPQNYFASCYIIFPLIWHLILNTGWQLTTSGLSQT